MQSRFLVLGLALTLFISLFTGSGGTSFGIYHESVRQSSSNCTFVRLPKKLCPSCKLLPFTGLGPNLDFNGVNRFDIFDILREDCVTMMQKYVDLNECDDRRRNSLRNLKIQIAKTNMSNADEVNKMKNNWPYKIMAYFMYAACETCCDCIPIGAREEQYAERKKEKTLINIYRGNCPAHFYYDTCKIWPEAKQITGPKGKQYRFRNGQWCADFKKWQFSPDAKGWLKNNNATGYTWRMRRAMNMIVKRARCTHESLWKECVRMELAQNRI